MNAQPKTQKRTVISSLLIGGILGLLSLIPLAPSVQANCPNEAIRETQVSTSLPSGTVSYPDCMALEMVSPPKKFNQDSFFPAFGASGNSARFSSVAALADTPKHGAVIDPYVATRTATGWVSHPTATPPQYARGSGGTGLPCLFSPDLSRWATTAMTDTQAKLGITTAFQGGIDGHFLQLSPTLAPTVFGTVGVFATGSCEGASVEVSRYLFTVPNAAYLTGDPSPQGAGSQNTYEAFLDQDGSPDVRLLARDKDGNVHGGSCGSSIGSKGGYTRGAVSPVASRIYFSTRPSQPEGTLCDPAFGLRIMQRLDTPAGPQISQLIASECARVLPPCAGTDGDDRYQGASQEGTRVLFTSPRQLADSDLDTTEDLYLHDSTRPVGERLTQLSAGDGTAPTPGDGAEVLGVADFGGDASHTYFVAKGVLTTTTNEAGQAAQAGEPNLYLHEYPGGQTRFIATLSSEDEEIWRVAPGSNAATAVPLLGPSPEDQSIGGDGHILVFQSTEPLLAGEDTDGARRDDYRYDADSGALQLITKAALGAGGSGPFDVAAASANPSREAGPQTPSFGRWVSEDGETVVFETAEALDPADTNATENAYMWREGTVTAIPFGIYGPTVSMDGSEVGFTSAERLLPEDGDGAKDVYLLRANGGFPIVVAPAPCTGEACQGAGTAPLAPPAYPRAVQTGNLPQKPPCKKKQVRRRGKCVAKQGKKSQRNSHKRSAKQGSGK